MVLATLGLLTLLSTIPEVRGVWLTTTANDALASPENVDRTMRQARAIGLNTVYVEVWKNGYTQFPSRTLQRVTGVDRHPSLRGERDLLKECVRSARKHQLRIFAWFEYGFMAAHEGTQNELIANRSHWLTKTRDKKLVSSQNPFVWMNPMRPEAQDFLLAMVSEAVQNYDLDGIQFDDRIAWPTSMGYDAFTVAEYAKGHGGQSPPDNHRDEDWIQWRANHVSKFAERLYRAVKAMNRRVEVSISPAVYPWSLENYACAWPTWMQKGLMDECVPQVYRPNAEAFEAEWRRQIEFAENARPRIVAGIMADSSSATISWEELEKELEIVRGTGKGHVWWYSRAVLGDHAKALAAYYRRRPTFKPKESP